MKVILLQELKGKGGEGDVVEVTRGYAVNYLLPRKLAVEATKGNLKQLELRRHNIAKREAARVDSADKAYESLNAKTVVIKARVGEEGQLFGSVTSAMIAEAIHEQFGIEIDRRKIELQGHIKAAGEHVVPVSIYRELKAELVVKVVDERAANSPAPPAPEDASHSDEEASAADGLVQEAQGAAAADAETPAADDIAATAATADAEAGLAEDPEPAHEAVSAAEEAPDASAEATGEASDTVEDQS
jgi:large subunit ribosomal protein L9